MTIDEFCARHPRLFHMATAGSLGQIKKFGLISTESILSLLQVEEATKLDLMSKRRSQMTPLHHPIHGDFVLRDQKPMRDAALERCLDGMTVPEWYRTLNSRVFMWASRERVDRLLAARTYRKSDQLVITIDTRPLIEKYYEQITLSTINSGAALYVPVQRGVQTFVPVADFPTVRGTKPIVEVTVTPGVPDMAEYILNAEIRKAS